MGETYRPKWSSVGERAPCRCATHTQRRFGKVNVVSALHQLSQTSPASHTATEHCAVIGKTIDRPDLLETVIEHGIAGVGAIRGIATVTAMSGEWRGRCVYKRVEGVVVCVEICHQQVAASLEK